MNVDIDATMEWLNIYMIYVVDWLFTIDRVIQYIIIIVAFVVAAWVSRIVRRRVQLPEATERRHPLRMYYYRLIRRMAFPVTLLVIVGIGILGYKLYGTPHKALSKTTSLALAWLLIRMGSTFISNPLISRSVTSVIWGIAALNILGYLGLVIDWLDGIKLDSGPNGLTAYDLITSTLSVAGFVWVAIAVSDLINRSLQSRRDLSPSGQALFSKISRFVLLAIAFLLGLNTVGIDLTAFAVFGGAMAVGIGLGLQKVFSNLIAGIILLSDNSIKPGDTIVSDGRYGKVNKLSARYISMITRDGTEHLIPNDDLINNRVENWSHSDENVRLKCPIGVHYQSDVHQAIQLSIEAAAGTPRVLKYPAGLPAERLR
ncbi:MAG: mechanosensitive ion channel [Thiolinea sp.]